MFFRTKHLQFDARPERPDPVYARKLQEVLGGQWGEMSVMMTYLFQGWNCRAPQKYRDLLLDVGTEEIAHVEMLCTMISRLLEGASAEDVDEIGSANGGVVGAALGGGDVQDALLSGMNPQHMIVSGLGATPTDSMGFPWTSRYTIASGNLMADFRFNVTAESQGRLQVCRLYNMTTDPGVRSMLQFMIGRDRMHQYMWLAAIEDLEREGLGGVAVPDTFPESEERMDVGFQFWSCSLDDDGKSDQGRWARGSSADGRGEFEFLRRPTPMGPGVEEMEPATPLLYGTPKQPLPPTAVGADGAGAGAEGAAVEAGPPPAPKRTSAPSTPKRASRKSTAAGPSRAELDAMTVEQLRERAKKLDIRGVGRMRRKDLVKALADRP